MGNCTGAKKRTEKASKKPTHHLRTPSSSISQNHDLRASRMSFQSSIAQRGKSRLTTFITGKPEATSGKISTSPKSTRDKAGLHLYLSSHFLFKSLPNETITHLIGNLKLMTFELNSVIFDTDSLGQFFFIIKRGKVEIMVDGKVNEILDLGRSFGEVALLVDGKRTTRARSLEHSELWTLSKDDYKSALKTENSKMHIENKQFLSTLPMFNMLSDKDLDSLAGVLTLHSYTQCQVIVSEGEAGDLAYIIKSGQVGCYINKEEKRRLGPGSFFGEQALIYDTRRTATVIALEQVEALSLGRRDMAKVLGSQLERVVYRNSIRVAFDKSPVLSNLLKHQMESVIDHVEIFRYFEGEIVIDRGCVKSSDIFIVLNGSLVGDTEHPVFSCLGDEELIVETQTFYQVDVKAKEDAVVAKLPLCDIRNVIGNDYDNLVKTNRLVEVLKKVPLLKQLSYARIQVIVSLFKSKNFEIGQVLFNQGETDDCFYIISKGSARVLVDNKEIRVVGKNDFFGERSILMKNPRTATVIAKEDLKCWVLAGKDFLSILDEPIRQNLVKRMQLQNDSIQMTDLRPVSLIGQGQFGSVVLCQDKANVEYALKSIPKSLIIQYDIIENLLLERKILLLLDHPMIVKLVKTFKDKNRVCLLMEYVRGMDMFDVLRAMNILKESESRFYSACLVLILEYLHSLDIVYRDLKPENIMIDSEGYPKLVDFGISRVMQGRTYTIIGTPHYMAPEVILGKGYGLQADYWSLGVLIYEFLYCNVPFAAKEEDPYSIYERVLERNLQFPAEASAVTANKLIQQLLSSNPSLRGSIEGIKDHRWFKGVTWENLLDKLLKPPYIPDIPQLKRLDSINKGISGFLEKHEKKIDIKNMCLADKKWEFEF